VLLIAEAANPEWVSVPLIGWSLAQAIAAQTPAHLVTQVRNRQAILRAGLREGLDFTAIDSERLAAPISRTAEFLRGGNRVGWTTLAALAPLSYYYFEHLVWKQFGKAIKQHEFDLVHRITPVSPTTPSILATHCARASIPFILGPLNGGVAWPKQFANVRRQEREWLSKVRFAHRYLPGYWSTLRDSAAIIAGSRSTFSEIPAQFKDKCIYLPENAVDPTRFSRHAPGISDGPLRACFVGRLVPFKGPDMLIEAVAPLVRSKRLHLDIVGDGPLMPALAALIETHGLGSGITLHGWIRHETLQDVMRESHMFLFPSIREFGGGVVLEAMALGVVPVVVDYAGPGELVTQEVGFKVPIGDRSSIINSFRQVVSDICDSPHQLKEKSTAACDRVRNLFTWEAKARQMRDIYDWARSKSTPPPVYDFDLP
jgi:glycosyltransferase involved in cell wall biosynthesis